MGKKKDDPRLASEHFTKIMSNIYLLLSTSDFKFNHMDPTQCVLFNEYLASRRNELRKAFFQKSLEDMAISGKR